MILTRLRHRPALFLLLLIGVGSAVAYHEIQIRLERPETRSFLESRAREVLRRRVTIGRIRYLPPAALALAGIELAETPRSPLVSIKQLVFGYSLLNFIRRDFRVPTAFHMDSPLVRLLSRRAPLPFIGSAFGDSAGRFPSELTIKNGEFHYPWGAEGKELVLSKVRLEARPDARGQIRLKLSAELEGVARGKLEVQGFTDVRFQRYELKVRLKDVSFLAPEAAPLRGLEGEFFLSDRVIEFGGVTSFLYDWQVKWGGRIEDWQAEPKISFNLKRQKEDPPFQLSLDADFQSHQMQGSGSWAGRLYSFQGRINREAERIVFSELKLPHQYTGRGELDPSSGDYQFWLEREKRRFHLRSNISRLAFETEFQADHAVINHMDWVVRGRARFRPLARRPGEGSLRLKGEVETDYLIVEYQPLEDFHGAFEISGDGIHAIDCRWNGVFHLGGAVLFRGGKPREDLVLRVEGFPLREVKHFVGRPVPSNLTGTLEGKLKLRGEPSRPETQGYFTIKQGTLGNLDFDRALIQFQGYPPYLKLHDSNILRGRNTLQLTGAIDLGLENIFHGIQIRGPDHLVIWKGMSVYWKKGESAVEAEKPLGDRVAMGLEVGQGMESSEDPDESHAMFGPKLKF